MKLYTTTDSWLAIHIMIYSHVCCRGYLVQTAQDTTRLAWYGGHWRPSLHVATTYWKRAPFISAPPPGTTSGLTSTQSNDDR